MFYEGRFDKPGALIYRDFDDSMLIDNFNIPDDWPRVIGVDFGGANTATIHLAENPGNGQWVAYKETLSGGKSTSEHVNQQKRLLGNAEEYEFVGGAHSEGQQRMDWEVAGLYVEEPVIADVEGGIDRVTQLIKEDRLRVFRSLRGLRDEIGSYQRKTDELGNPTDEIKDKRKFHRLDALRYAAIHIIESYGPVYIYVDGERVYAS